MSVSSGLPNTHQRTTDVGVTKSCHGLAHAALLRMVDPAQPDLVKGLIWADSRAFDAAYERLRAPLYAFLVRLSGQRALAEDLLQETWLRLARRATVLPVDAELRPWLFTVARNLYISHRRWALLDAQRLRELGVLPEATLTSPFEALAATETQRFLEKALLRLPLKYREVTLSPCFGRQGRVWAAGPEARRGLTQEAGSRLRPPAF